MSSTPVTRRGRFGSAGVLAGLGLTATSAAALPPPKDNGRRHGVYEEQVLAAPGDWGVDNFRIPAIAVAPNGDLLADRKSTRLNSSHVAISYAVFCLKKKRDQ